MDNTIRVFVPMPGGKPDEELWPVVMQEAVHAARVMATKHDVKLKSAHWHQSSEWSTETIDGKEMAGWTFMYETV